jgi:hypothetical protein
MTHRANACKKLPASQQCRSAAADRLAVAFQLSISRATNRQFAQTFAKPFEINVSEINCERRFAKVPE